MENPQTNQTSIPAGETRNYVSPDGLVEIVTKTSTARRYPPHSYPVVCLRFKPRPGTRIQKHGDGCEVLLTHLEVVRHLAALNQADAKAAYRWKFVPEKPAARKAHWDKINQQHHAKNNYQPPVK